jgi:hypothetical protein
VDHGREPLLKSKWVPYQLEITRILDPHRPTEFLFITLRKDTIWILKIIKLFKWKSALSMRKSPHNRIWNLHLWVALISGSLQEGWILNLFPMEDQGVQVDPKKNLILQKDLLLRNLFRHLPIWSLEGKDIIKVEIRNGQTKNRQRETIRSKKRTRTQVKT